MKMKLWTLLPLYFCTLYVMANSQANISGNVVDLESREPMQFVNVLLYKNGKQQAVTITDVAGRYRLEHLEKGSYELKFRFTGFETKSVKNVAIEESICKVLNAGLVRDMTRSINVMALEGSSKSQASRNKGNPNQVWNGFANSDDDDLGPDGLLGKRSPFEPKNRNKKKSKAPIRPIDFKGENYEYLKENGFQTTASSSKSTFCVNVDGSSYSNVRRYLKAGRMPGKDMIRIEEMINYFDYDYAQPEDGSPFAMQFELSDCPWEEKHKIVQIGIQTRELNEEEMPPMNIIFLVDVSASMIDDAKLPLVKESIKVMASKLRKVDQLCIIAYAEDKQIMLPPTSGTELVKIYRAVENLKLQGKTNGALGLKYAYKMAESHFIKGGANRIILATDGDFNHEMPEEKEWIDQLEAYSKKNINLSVLGFGAGNYKDSTLAALTRGTNGTYFYIDKIEEADRVLNEELPGTIINVAKDVKVQIEFDRTVVRSYRLIGYANRMMKNVDFVFDSIGSAEMGSGQSVTALYELELKSGAEEDSTLGSVHLRYKLPTAYNSFLMSKGMKVRLKPLSDASDNFKIATAAAVFGMRLRTSRYAGFFKYEDILKLARSGQGKNPDCYRKEFLHLITEGKRVEKEASKRLASQ